MKTTAMGTVSPGVIPAIPQLEPGDYSISVLAVRGENDGLFDENGNPATSENQEVTLKYPGDFAKTHQVKDADELFARIAATIRNRFGVYEFIFKSAAEMPEAGDEIQIGV